MDALVNTNYLSQKYNDQSKVLTRLAAIENAILTMRHELTELADLLQGKGLVGSEVEDVQEDAAD